MVRNSKIRSRRKKRKPESFFYRGQYFDFPMLFIIIFLVCFGLLMIYSSSSYRATLTYNDSAYFLKKQLVWVVLGFFVMFFVSMFNYKKYQVFTKYLYWLAIVIQLWVIIQEQSSHGAKRWIQLGPIQFQPSEVSKVIIILFLAHMINAKIKVLKNGKELSKIGAYIFPLFILIAKENLSTGIIILAITFVMLFVSSNKTIFFVVTLLVSVGLAGIVLMSASYRLERIQIWRNPEIHPKGFQTMQALYAIGSGGIFGKGIGQSMQKMGFIPESHNDMIFSIVCEELGIFGAGCIIAMFMMLLYRIAEIARRAPDLYSALICTGIMTQVGMQIFINIGVVTNTIPPTGIPLPFISYGGTSVLVLLMEMGMVLGISRHIKVRR